MTDDAEDRAGRAFASAFHRKAQSFEPRDVALVDSPRRPRGGSFPRVVSVAAAVVLIIAGTAFAVENWAGRDPGRAVAGPEAAPTSPGERWRFESYRDVVIRVPASWRYAPSPGPDWCAGTPGAEPASTEPYVDTRSDSTVIFSIGCPRTDAEPNLHGNGVPRKLWAPHVWFSPAAEHDNGEVPDGRVSSDGWTRLVRTIGAARVHVLTDKQHLAQAEQIIASAQTTGAHDPYGCSPKSPIQAGNFVRPPDPFQITALQAVQRVAVCQYTLNGNPEIPGLLASHELSEDAANRLLAAIQQAPEGGGPDTPANCMKDMYGDHALVLRLSSGDTVHDAYLYYDSCFGNGIDDGTTLRALTQGNCRSLWSGRLVDWSGSQAPYAVCNPTGQPSTGTETPR